MEKIEFDYYDWNEFKQFLDQLPDKDAAKLIATIQNIENNGLIIAERQLWVKKLEKISMSFVLSGLQIFKELSISRYKDPST